MRKTVILLSAATLVAAAAPIPAAGDDFAREMDVAMGRMMGAMQVPPSGNA